MSDEIRIFSQAPTVSVPKKVYRQPHLINYGEVRLLTQTLSKGGLENTMGNEGMASDPAIKENVARIGDHPLGFGVYLFDYKPEFQKIWGVGRQFGVMADEVECVVPEAVQFHPDGYKVVNYGILGISRIQ